jgi:predicted GH43/DUF377 family glycosyl hydrolase
MAEAGLYCLRVTARELFQRHPANPILKAADWPYPVNTVFNPAAVQVGAETVVLARVEGLDGISHLSVARSPDGASGWEIDSVPLLAPAAGVEEEKWGFEDARAVWIPERERFAITCTAYGPPGPCVYLAWTEDFRTVERHGILMPPDDKNSAFLPERIDGKWILFHRPTGTDSAAAYGEAHGQVFLSRSEDLKSWTAPELVMAPQKGAHWDGFRIGIGPPPLKTDAGWLVVYHGVKQTVGGGVYRVGLALTALDDPARLLCRADDWVLGPDTFEERVGDVPNVVFPCGLIHDEAAGDVRLYYGAADTSICLATARLDELLERVLESPV